MPIVHHAMRHCVSEWAFESGRAYGDPFNEATLDVVFTDPDGREWRVPAYWAGEQEWRVRFAGRSVGTYSYRTICSDESNPDLHGQEGRLEVSEYVGQNPLLRHGPLRVNADRRHLEHLDGAPFFWLGDLWWLGMTKRLSWPDGFQRLVADRKAKGFTVIQLTAGNNCDQPAFDPRGANEAGHPWEADFARINPAFFDMADLRIQWLVRQGIVPCIFGTWGFYLLWMGQRKMEQHWRYLIARWGAYPVVWSLAGSMTMPYYTSTNREVETEQLKRGWTDLARYVQAIDPYGHVTVAHTFPYQKEPCEMETEGLMDCYFIHTGQGGREGFGKRVQMAQELLRREPRMPLIQGEGCFEGFMEDNREEVQRWNFWAFMLLGMRGVTYSANGLWAFNNAGDLFGPAPYGATLSNALWEAAAALPGSRQVGIGKHLLERYPWQRFEHHPEWIEPHASEQDPLLPYAGGIPGEVRVIYMPRPVSMWRREPTMIHKLEPEIAYRAFYYDPKEGAEYPLGCVSGEASWPIPPAPLPQDWALVLERERGRE